MFSEIERQHHEVTSSGNPISVDLKTRYVVKGVGQEKIIASVLNIFLNDKGNITKLEDKWDGSLPESGIKNVSVLNPWSWLEYYGNWAFWFWSWIWYTRLWMVRAAAHVVMIPRQTFWTFMLTNSLFSRLSVELTQTRFL